MKLEFLSTEALELIFLFSDGNAVLALWKSGCPSLRQKMVNGGVTDLHFECQKHHAPQWPKSLTSFKLESLRVYSSVPLRIGNLNSGDSHLALLNEIQKLPRTLKRLELCFPNTSQVFHLCSPNVASTNEPSPQLQAWAMSDSFSHLEHFRICSTDSPHEYNGSIPLLPSTILAQLPRTLKSLHLGRFRTSFSDEQLQELPSSLESLVLPLTRIAPSALHCLPKSLTHISHHLSYSESVFTSEAIQLLCKEPSILPLLKLSLIAGDQGLAASLYEVCGNQWPPSVTSIELQLDLSWSLISSNDFKFHSQLETLILIMPPYELTESSEWLNTYPFSGLTKLTVDDLAWTVINPEMWPRTLTHFSIDDGMHVTPLSFHLLPRHLTELTIADGFVEGIFAEYSKEDALKAGQQALQLPSDHRIWIEEQAIVKSDLYELNAAYRSDVDDYFTAIESGALFGLPLRLTKLSITERSLIECGEYGLPLMPPHLTSLMVSSDLLGRNFKGAQHFIPEVLKGHTPFSYFGSAQKWNSRIFDFS